MADSVFLKSMNGYRSIIPRANETLQDLALRELGDASQWTMIAWVNGLVSPYLAQTPADVAPGVVMFGTALIVPASSPEPASGTDDLYYTDLLLTNGFLTVDDDGDLASVSGVANLEQALRHRIQVDRGELVYHAYGAYLNEILGRGNTPQNLRLAEFYVRSSLLEDERVRSITSVVATASGMSMVIVADVIAISGVSVDVEISI